MGWSRRALNSAVVSGEPVQPPPPPRLVPVEVVTGSSSPSNEKVLPVGKIQDKIVLEQLPPRRRMVITQSSAYSKHGAPVVLSP